MYSREVNELIPLFLESKSGAWSPTTLRSESSRLWSLTSELSMGPQEAYDSLLARGLKPYTIKTAFVRLGSFYTWASDEGHAHASKNPFTRFIRERALLFRNAYTKERLSANFVYVQDRLKKVRCPIVRELATEMLTSGLRVSECLNRDVQDNRVVGKRGLERHANVSTRNNSNTVPYIDVYTGLREVGLKPHTLRKVFANRLVERGFKLPELMAVMGWKSVQTATSYLQPKEDAELLALVKEAVK